MIHERWLGGTGSRSAFSWRYTRLHATLGFLWFLLSYISVDPIVVVSSYAF
jgi:hypothetical protein